MIHVEESVALTLEQKRRMVARLLREKAGLRPEGATLVHRRIEDLEPKAKEIIVFARRYFDPDRLFQ